ncbi:type I restriction endonuclease [Aminicella lysinilytica]|uniref:Restriction endonuclease type I HsdR N-terminal domain-containing protein n=1 Tax=Aminicella lysinilytica TaxID=433323 RepID=A0A4R6QD81_9FIRM|nr:type I restriction endonuclease [Aminicella lysinilytica]TDP59813.1 hypothetical protein EV211_10255 [Aminicella lysinilytica]
MELKESLPAFVERIKKTKDAITNEEMTKTSMIMPFFQMLGYDIFNPLEFIPEFTADVGTKKGEKVDYAIVIDESPLILIECKSCNENLDNHSSQLFRYFGTTLAAKFGILTNGIEYRFFTDLDNENRMDETPFLVVNLLDMKDRDIQELKKFTRDTLDVDMIVDSAEELKYNKIIKDWFAKELDSPSPEFIKYVLGNVYEGTRNQKVIERFTPTIKKALQQFINDTLNSKITSALNSENVANAAQETADDPDNAEPESKINTTDEELEAFWAVKSILYGTIDTSRLAYRDTESYFGILVDDNNRKWVCRVIVESNSKHILISDANKNPVRYDIDTVDDIYNYAKEIKESCKKYIEE